MCGVSSEGIREPSPSDTNMLWEMGNIWCDGSYPPSSARHSYTNHAAPVAALILALIPV